ncbi:hypothetical protein G7Y89_g5325 [Cudoniella acicularis]|uniref:F-box domain-containing protein n=1 Tax=Cudoniella acicularis TaxID=354080 RepID=A0A8H4RPV0_9HELO|nr:hypothetical protein G7Y89_g5325 [Cudoniella acicularis]
MAFMPEDLSKRPPGQQPLLHPTKRHCTSLRNIPGPSKKAILPIQNILHLPEDAVWALCKQDLRNCFLALQKYAQDPYPLTAPISSASSHEQRQAAIELSPLLHLPLEIRELIYTFLLPPPSSSPIRGPHPRQLQNPIKLSRLIPANLLLLNRQIRNEALPLLYGSRGQKVFIKIDYNVWAHKTCRSDLVLTSAVTSCIKHIHLSVHLGSEKRNSRPVGLEAYARLKEVEKGIKKVGKWLAGADLQSMQIGWQEPPQTYTWEQKKEVLDGLRTLCAVQVEAGEINWGLEWNRGRRYRFEVEYLKELERDQQYENAITNTEVQ